MTLKSYKKRTVTIYVILSLFLSLITLSYIIYDLYLFQKNSPKLETIAKNKETIFTKNKELAELKEKNSLSQKRINELNSLEKKYLVDQKYVEKEYEKIFKALYSRYKTYSVKIEKIDQSKDYLNSVQIYLSTSSHYKTMTREISNKSLYLYLTSDKIKEAMNIHNVRIVELKDFRNKEKKTEYVIVDYKKRGNI